MTGFRRMGTCGALAIATLLGATASRAQAPSPTTTAGPGRIICRSAANCVLGVGIPPSIRYEIDASVLPDVDRQRLVKQCTAAAAACVATVTGTEKKRGIKATAIKFHN